MQNSNITNKRAIGVLTCAFLIFSARASFAAGVDYLLEIDGVVGESKLIGHEGSIAIDQFHWGIHSTAAPSGGAGGGGRPKIEFDDFSWSQVLDSSTPPLFSRVASGEHIKNAKLSLTRPGDGRAQTYFTMLFGNVILSSLDLAGTSGVLPRVDGVFNYEVITMTYFPQKPDGSLGSPITATYDLKKGAGSIASLVAVFARATTTADVTAVPVPPGLPLLMAGLLALVPALRRRTAGS